MINSNGVYTHREYDKELADQIQLRQELVWITDSGLLRYIDKLGESHYITGGIGGGEGSPGDKGPTGDKGATGDKGELGNKGPTGDKGPNGDPGSLDFSILSSGGMVKSVSPSGSLELAVEGVDYASANSVMKFYLRSFTNTDTNTVALGSIDTSAYKGIAILLSLVCHQVGYVFSGSLIYNGFSDCTSGNWQMLRWDLGFKDANGTSPSFMYEVMSDATTTNFRVRVMR